MGTHHGHAAKNYQHRTHSSHGHVDDVGHGKALPAHVHMRQVVLVVEVACKPVE